MTLRQPVLAASLFLTMIATAGCGGSHVPRINAGGATFVEPIMQEWSGEYDRTKNVQIDYVAKGSGYGIEQMTRKTLDFGCSDAPMKKDQLDAARADGGDVVHVPLVIGTVAVIYNLPGISEPLRLTGDVLADIYRKDPSVARWNAPRIKDLNPAIAASLPDKEIVVVARSESSGTTNIFSEYLAKSSDVFRASPGASTKPKWPQGVLGQDQNDGVAGFVKANAGAIGYVEVLFAKRNNLPTALLKNKAGQFIAPGAEGGVAAAEEALKTKPTKEPYSLHELTYSLTDMDGAKSYPISGMSYAVLYAKLPLKKGPAIVDFLKWATTEGQAATGKLEYAPLPEELRKKVQERLSSIVFE